MHSPSPARQSRHQSYIDRGTAQENEKGTHDFRLLLVISFFNAAPSSGLSSSKEHKRSSETDMTAPKFCFVSYALDNLQSFAWSWASRRLLPTGPCKWPPPRSLGEKLTSNSPQ